ncbi:MAG: toll/interleukin-1 receptor domain-containing protein [Clostridia bacterium]|nr:toll/interleukin-1 receptor domain-containing protein [Clostridia bacterium]
MERKYIAFISYRHTEPDMQAAKLLHRLLERYTVPARLRKNGRKRLGVVFRDQEELPVSSSLSDSICRALDNSEYLIVVCSPETPKSIWVRHEIEYFLAHHDRSRVITVLAAGTPDVSFPNLLTHIPAPDGGTPTAVEPLAANIAAPTARQRRHLLHKESLRIIAALLQCPYDELKQRERAWRRHRLLSGASAVLVLAAAALWGLHAWRTQVQALNLEAARTGQQALLSSAQAQLHKGDRPGALRSALQAYDLYAGIAGTGAAEAALADALYAYQDETLRPAFVIRQDSPVVDHALLPDREQIVSSGADGILRCYSVLDGTLCWQLPLGTAVSSPAESVYLPVAGTLLIWDNAGVWAIDPSIPKIAWSRRGADLLGRCIAADQQTIALLSSVQNSCMELQLLNAADGAIRSSCVFPLPEGFRPGGLTMAAMAVNADLSTACISMECLDLQGQTQRLFLAFDLRSRTSALLFSESSGVMQHIVAHPAISSTGHLAVIDYAPADNIVRIRLYDSAAHSLLFDGAPVRLGGLGVSDPETFFFANDDTALVSVGSTILTFSLESGSLLAQDVLPGSCAGMFSAGGSLYGCIVDTGLFVYIVNGSSTYGVIQQELSQPAASAKGTVIGGLCIAYVPQGDASAICVSLLSGDTPRDALSAVSASGISWHASLHRGQLALAGEQALYLLDPVSWEVVSRAECPAGVSSPVITSDGLHYISHGTKYNWADGTSSPLQLPDAAVIPDSAYASAVSLADQTVLTAAVVQQELTPRLTLWRDGIPMGLYDAPVRGVNQSVSLFTTTQRSDFDVSTLSFEEYLALFDTLFQVDREDYAYTGSLAVSPHGFVVFDILLTDSARKGFMIFQPDREAWLCADDPSRKSTASILACGSAAPIFASVDPDHTVRIYDASSGTMKSALSLPQDTSDVSRAIFAGEDRLLILAASGQLLILDVQSGALTVLPDVSLSGNHIGAALTPGGRQLVIWDADRSSDGLIVDLTTGQILARVPGLVWYHAPSDELLKWDSAQTQFVIYPRRTADLLVQEARRLLGDEP